jgi:hypothetical protein
MKNNLHTSLLVLIIFLSYSLGINIFGHDGRDTQEVSTSQTGTTPHPPGLPSVWKGRNISELVAILGEPDMILETAVRGIVVYGDTHSVMYVYIPTPGSGDQGYQVYVVEHDTGKILAYQRR